MNEAMPAAVVTAIKTLSFASKPCPPQPKYLVEIKAEQEGNNPMNYASATVTAPATEIQDQRKYLERRLQEVYNTKRDPLEAQFGLIDDDAPNGPKELAERLASGKFIVRGADGTNPDRYRYSHWTDLITWRDPARKADKDGFDAAKKDLKAKKQEALDIIKIDEPKAGLDAIKALEAWEPTGKAN